MLSGMELLKMSRTATGMTQRQVASLASCPQSTVARIETGAISPTVATFNSILAVTGTTTVLAPTAIASFYNTVWDLAQTLETQPGRVDLDPLYQAAFDAPIRSRSTVMFTTSMKKFEALAQQPGVIVSGTPAMARYSKPVVPQQVAVLYANQTLELDFVDNGDVFVYVCASNPIVETLAQQHEGVQWAQPVLAAADCVSSPLRSTEQAASWLEDLERS